MKIVEYIKYLFSINIKQIFGAVTETLPNKNERTISNPPVWEFTFSLISLFIVDKYVK